MHPIKHSAHKARHASTAKNRHSQSNYVPIEDGKLTVAVSIRVVPCNVQQQPDEFQDSDDKRSEGDGSQRQSRCADKRR